jgi:hypothetical protein
MTEPPLFRSLEDMSDEDMTAIRITLGNSTVRDRFTGTAVLSREPTLSLGTLG